MLRARFSEPGRALEVGSGTGQHAAHFAAALPHLAWQPSERDPDAFASIEAWAAESDGARPLPPVRLDVTDDASWPAGPFDLVFSANMVHIAPWEACLGLLRGAARVLSLGGALVLYGPFRIGGAHTAPSNDAFDADLRRRDPRWGVRDLEAVADVAARNGLSLAERVEMPANNQIAILRRGG